MARVLVTGFGPFPGAPENPSAAIARRLSRMPLPRHDLATFVFPTAYRAVDRHLPALTAAFRPHVIVMFGLAANTPHVRIETRARNAISRKPDVQGEVPAQDVIRVAGAMGRHGEAPFARLAQASRATGVKTRLSADAGTYVCNYAYWRAIELLRRRSGLHRAVFVHVPDPGRRDAPSLEQLVRAARAIVAAAAWDLPAR